MTGSIYVIRNVINGKCYVGQTIQKTEDRLKQHYSIGIKYNQ
ncbi:GIY-YIG nuclease family protein [Thermaerobacillus caldiproteolyticus]|nr:GIY-YIG nuclease family protein [Anoxybacillus caldiproteolyticus]